jgi:hypothetical protein
MIDGRNVDQRLGALVGEGALQRVKELEQARPIERVPQAAEGPSYYGLPLLKEAVWKWPIPTYLYIGGMAGCSAVLGAAALLRPGLRALSRRSRFIAAGGAAASAALLIADLGVPARFVYMMRVFRPTSPMSIGTWLLGAFGAAASASLLPGAAGDRAALGAAFLGLPLCGYTGVLLANTAVPLWQEGRTLLPPLFCASAAASAAAALETLGPGARGEPVVRRLAVLGKAAELAAAAALEQRLSRIERIGRPLQTSHSGALWKLSKICMLASLGLSLLPRKPRGLRVTAGLLGTAGALAARFALIHGGKASARDPQAVFAQQRATPSQPPTIDEGPAL